MSEQIDIAVGRRVRINELAQPCFHGIEGRIVARDKRLPVALVELDRQPINCTTRRFLVPDKHMEWL